MFKFVLASAAAVHLSAMPAPKADIQTACNELNGKVAMVENLYAGAQSHKYLNMAKEQLKAAGNRVEGGHSFRHWCKVVGTPLKI